MSSYLINTADHCFTPITIASPHLCKIIALVYGTSANVCHTTEATKNWWSNL